MPTNLYFNNFPSSQVTSEQLLVEDLIIESMQIHGMDVFYLPRTTRDQIDYLYGEDTLKQYVKAYPIEMYLENVTGMDGEGDFISKFGLEIRDEMQFLVSRRRFKATVPQIRPNEGDLIYVPLVQNFFEITFVEHENDQAMFHTLGRGRGGNVYVYAIKMKQFVFSNEIVETGVAEVDNQIKDHYTKIRLSLSNVSGSFLNDEVVYQGANLASSTAKALIYDFVPNSHMDVYRTQGIFANSSGIIVGTKSNASANLVASNDTALMNNPFEDIFDNARIESEANTIIDWSEHNPFGEG